jgi:hypothetical protein
MELLGLFDKAKNADLYKQLGDWIDKVRVLPIENDRLLDELKVLKEQIRFKGIVERINGHIFVQGDHEEICPRCAELDSKLIHLIPVRSKYPPYQRAGCPACRTEFHHNVPCTRKLASP